MSLTSRLFFLSFCVAISTSSVATLSGQEIEPVRLSGTADSVNSGLSIVYDPNSGRVTVSAPATTDLTALQLLSESGSFTEECQSLDGAFDVCEADEVFKLETDGFATVDFGPILETNLDGKSLLLDLKVNGASVGGGFDVGDGPFLVHSDFVIPEPASSFLLGCGLCFLCTSLRGRMRS